MRRAPTTIALVVLVAMSLLTGFQREGARDFHWHLVLGEQTLHAGGPVRTEQLSFTAHGQPVFVSAWLADLVMALAFRAGGYAGCELLHGLLIAATLVCLWWHARRRGASELVCTAITLLALAGSSSRLYLRPEMFAFAASAAVLLLLEAHERTGRRAALVGVVALMALWANLHGSVIVGLLPVTFYALERAWRDRAKALELLALPLAAFAASCVNPEGIHLPLAFRIVSPNFSTYVAEWRPLSLGLITGPLWILFGLALLSAIAAGRRVSPWRLGLVIILGVVATRYHRFLSHLVFACVPLIGDSIGRHPALSDLRRRIGAVGFSAAAGFALIFLFAGRGTIRHLGIGVEPGVYPTRACEFARAAHLPGHMLNSYNYGDYLLFCMPGQPVFIDQRAWSAYPDSLFGELTMAMGSDAEVMPLAERHDIRWAFLHDTDPIARYMASSPETWRLVYFDDDSFIYVRAVYGKPGESFELLNPLDLPRVLNATSEQLPRLHEELALQERRCATCWRTLLVRGAVELAEKRYDDFDKTVHSLTEAQRERPEVEFLRARWAIATRRFPLAFALLKHLRKVGDNPIGAAALMADVQVRAGDVAGARRTIEEIAQSPGGAVTAARLRMQLLGDRPTVVPIPGGAPPDL